MNLISLKTTTTFAVKDCISFAYCSKKLIEIVSIFLKFQGRDSNVWNLIVQFLQLTTKQDNKYAITMQNLAIVMCL